MPPRLRPLIDPPILLARRGANAHAPEHTTEGYELALRLGATGLSGDAWVSADGAVVLHADGTVGGRLRRRRIDQCTAEELDALPHPPLPLERLFDHGVALVLDVRDAAAVDPALALARRCGVIDRLWLRHPDLGLLEEWRSRSEAVHLVQVATVTSLPGGPERHAARLREAHVDALQMGPRDWTGGLTTLVHRFRRLAWGAGADHPRQIVELLDDGVDAVEGGYVERLVDGARAVTGPRIG